MLRLSLLWALLILCVAAPASAQTNQYSNTTSGAINDLTCGGTVLTRTFAVGTSYTVADVNLGVLLSHTYRADLEIRLTSPAGTVRNIMISTAGDGDNLNDLFDDEAATLISAHATSVTDPLTPTPPPYSHSFRPADSLSAFDGQNALGTWTLTICDNAGVDVGTFTRADLYITQAAASADLSLTKTVSSSTPSNGSSISYTLTVTNAASSAATASGITVQDSLPVGFTFVSASGTGTYSSATGVWSVGTLAPGASATLTIAGTVSATSGTVTNIAQISASSAPDPDSTPNNGVSSEDDYASAAFTVSSVLLPPTCPISATQQIIANGDFASGTGPSWPSWTAGAVWYGTGSANADNDGTSGTLSQSGLSGLSYGPGSGNGAVIQLSVWWRNGAPASTSTSAQLTVSVGGTAYAQVTTNSSGGTSASVTYLNGASGNVATLTEFSTTGWRINLPTSVSATGALSFAFAPGGGTSDDFQVDNVTLYTCAPVPVTIVKSSSIVSDPANGATNPKAIPGATIRYCLLVTNPGPSVPDTLAISDVLPASVTFTAGSMRTGTTCAGAATVEDENSSGADETDPVGMALSGTTVNGTAATLAASASVALVFDAIVN